MIKRRINFSNFFLQKYDRTSHSRRWINVWREWNCHDTFATYTSNGNDEGPHSLHLQASRKFQKHLYRWVFPQIYSPYFSFFPPFNSPFFLFTSSNKIFQDFGENPRSQFFFRINANRKLKIDILFQRRIRNN